MSEIKFTREELDRARRNNETLGDVLVASGANYAGLAAFALSLLDRAEKAESELAEAEEAIRDLASWFVEFGAVLPTKTVPCSDPECRACNALVNSPAVRRAMERGKG